jgi:hypothetical protein
MSIQIDSLSWQIWLALGASFAFLIFILLGLQEAVRLVRGALLLPSDQYLTEMKEMLSEIQEDLYQMRTSVRSIEGDVSDMQRHWLHDETD